MDTITNPLYRQRIGALIMATPALRPGAVQLGDGGHDPATQTPLAPRGSLYSPLPGTHPATPLLAGDGATVQVSVALAAGSEGITFSEAVLLSEDGTPILHATTTPQTVASGVDVLFNFALNGPLVTDGGGASVNL